MKCGCDHCHAMTLCCTMTLIPPPPTILGDIQFNFSFREMILEAILSNDIDPSIRVIIKVKSLHISGLQ